MKNYKLFLSKDLNFLFFPSVPMKSIIKNEEILSFVSVKIAFLKQANAKIDLIGKLYNSFHVVSLVISK